VWQPWVSQPAEPQGEELPPIEPAPRVSRFETGLRWFLEVVVIVAAAFLLALLLQLFVVKPFEIPSESMEPTLVMGDRVLVNRMVYHFRSPERGDVIVFDPPGVDSTEPFIKRVVAIAGDTVSVHDGLLWVNGKAQDEPYLKDATIFEDYPEVTIEPGHVWAMGDNRNNSGDSRVFGQVSEDLIIGEAFAVYWPPRHMKGL
jgi:signal peptidase I